MTARGPERYARQRKVYAKGDPREAYLYLVAEQADRMLGRLPPGVVERDELLSLGAIGLLEGLERYRGERGVPIEAYLRSVIKHRILDGLRQQDRVPKGLRAKERRVREAYAKVEQETLRPASDDEVASLLAIGPETFQEWLKDLSYTTVWSLDALEEQAGVEILETRPGPEQEAEGQEVKETLAAAIDKLPAREKEVLWAHYYMGYTLHEVALALSLSDSYVSQLHSRSILRLRGALGRKRASLIGGGNGA